MVTGINPTGAPVVLQWTVSHGPCAVSSDTVVINLSTGPPAPVVTGDTAVCQGNSTTLTANSGPGLNYEWFDAASGGTSLGTDASLLVSPTSTDTFWVEAIDSASGGCIGPRTAFFVAVEAAVAAAFSADTSNCPLVVFSDATTGNPSGWLWDFGDGNTATTQNATNNYTSRGPFTVTLITSNLCGADTTTGTVAVGCISSRAQLAVLEKRITVFENPNNGVFTVRFHDLQAKTLLLQVMDLRGRLVYSRDLSGQRGDFDAKVELVNPAKGIYFVKIFADEKVVSRKVLVE